MRKQKSGKIINITSVGGIWGQPFNDIYCASKFAVEGLSESQAASHLFILYPPPAQPASAFLQVTGHGHHRRRLRVKCLAL